jgi:hypothetical protein
MLGVSFREPFFAAVSGASSVAIVPSPSNLGLGTFNHFHDLLFPPLACPDMLFYRWRKSSVCQAYEETVSCQRACISEA